MASVMMMPPTDPMLAVGPMQMPVPEISANNNQDNNLVALVNRLGIERVELSQTRMHQVMSQVTDANSKRQVAIQLLEQITKCTDGAGKIDVSKMDAAVVDRAREIFGDRLGNFSGKLNAQQTASLRSNTESIERQHGNLEVTDQMKLQQLVQNLQREVQLFTGLMERLHRICEMAMEGMRGR